MHELDAHNTWNYLCHRHGFSGPPAHVEWLSGGVSNCVLRIEPVAGAPFVIKQSRPQLRTQAAWFSRLDRIFREIGMLRLLAEILPADVVPAVLFEDRENFLFAMEAVAADHTVWKRDLLDGRVDPTVADRLGTYLGLVHARTYARPDLAAAWDDWEVFDQLRIDPFYRRLAAVHPESAPQLSQLETSMRENAVCLVLADYSPKNILISGSRITVVDFETGHYGDPAFDLGFFLSHLLLKTVLHADRFAEYAGLTTRFWSTYLAELPAQAPGQPLSPENLLSRTLPHLAGCMGARIDATSPVDYLPDAPRRQLVREFCRDLFNNRPGTWAGVLSNLQTQLTQGEHP